MIYSNNLENLFNDAFNYNRPVQVMRTDITKEDDNYVVEIDVPGVKKENINLSLENGYLEVSVNKEAKEANYIVNERKAGKYSRRFYLGDGFVEEDIRAKLADGVLTLVFPVEKKTEKRTISIQ